MTVLLGLGLTLLGSIDAAIPPSQGWQIEITGRGTCRVRGPAGTMLYDGQADLFPAWQQLAAAAGHAELLAGEIGLAAAAPAGPAAQLQALAQAAQDGYLAGALVPVTGRAGRPA